MSFATVSFCMVICLFISIECWSALEDYGPGTILVFFDGDFNSVFRK